MARPGWGRPLLTVGILLALVVPVGDAIASGSPVSVHDVARETPATVAGSPSPVGWPTYQGGSDRSGFRTFGGPGAPSVAWSECPTNRPIRSGPVTDGSSVYVSDSLGAIFALNLSSNGSTAWNYSIHAQPTEPDLVDGEFVVGTSTGSLFSLWAANGTPDWHLTLGSRVVQGVVDGDGELFVGTQSGAVYAFDAATGSERWVRYLPEAVGGAPSFSAGELVVPGANGSVFAFGDTGSVLWSKSLGEPVATAPTFSGPDVFVAGLNGTLYDLFAANGTLRWSATAPYNDTLFASPAVGPNLIVADLGSGSVWALNRSSGATLWETAPLYAGGIPVVTPPVLTPTGVYAPIEGYLEMTELDPKNGSTVWAFSDSSFILGDPALGEGTLVFADDAGCVTEFGPRSGPTQYPVSGLVENASGAPVALAAVTAGISQTLSSANGSFTLTLPNGSYALTASAPGLASTVLPIVVNGAPISGLVAVLRPFFTYPVRGFVDDAASNRGVAGLTLLEVAALGFSDSAVTQNDGSFTLRAPNGTVNLTVLSSPDFGGTTISIVVHGAAPPTVRVVLPPTGLAPGESAPPWAFLVGLLAGASGAGVAFGWDARRRRVDQGLPPGLLSPFGRFVAMRSLLIVPQLLLVLFVLYFFGSVVDTAALGRPPAFLAPQVGFSCTWSSYGCVIPAVGDGYGSFVLHLFTGQWGYATYNALREPVLQFFLWYFGNSLELALLSLTIALGIAYPVAIASGSRTDPTSEVAGRMATLAGLLFPTFLIALAAVYFALPTLERWGDTPFGLTPTLPWYLSHGGVPDWVGVAGTTSPTGLPLVDGAIHGDWAFEANVLPKTLLQAGVIALVYLAIFLRHLGHRVRESMRELHITASRARGVPERVLLWRHTGRRVLPYFALVFVLSLPAFIGTQAVVEAIFGDSGVGNLLLIEVSDILGTPLGFLGPVSGQFYQVALFLLAASVLLTILVADVLARALDPRRRVEGT